MADSTMHHEEIYRGKDEVARLADTRVTVFGVGAIGSNLVDTLTRQGVNNLFVLDKDRVDRHNVGTQTYGIKDVGKRKVDALQEHVFDNVGYEIGPIAKTLDTSNVKRYVKHHDSHLLIDAFDNTESRRLLQDEARRQGVPLLHIGLFADYGEVIWDERYTVPKDGGRDICDYPLARNIIMLTVTVASEAIIGYLIDGNRRSFRLTLKDLQVRELH